MREYELLEKIEQRGVFQIMKYLLENETAFLTELKENLYAGQHAIYTAIRNLLELKLVFQEREPPFNKRVFKLTDRGKKVAELLQKIEEILQEEE